MAAEDIAYKYTGKDPLEAHHSGIPARDLTEVEVKDLDKERRETLRHSPIYEKADAAPKVEEKKPDEKPEPKAAEKK